MALGNFSGSSSNIRLEGTGLEADCRKNDGTVVPSSIDLNTCVTNDDGSLRFGGVQFAGSCKNIVLNQSVLSADCARRDGSVNHSSLDLNEHIGNENGVLKVGAPSAPGAPGGPNAQAQEILAAQNRYRAEVGVPPLQWSGSLAASAQQWANHLAATGTFQHSGAGENLAEGTAGAFSVTKLVDMWGNEKQHFVHGTFPNVSNNGNWADVGHYTQMVWRNTTEVGCGLARGNGNDVLVCHYNPAGNVTGQGVY